MILTEKQASKMNMYIPRKKKQSKQKYFCMRNKDETFAMLPTALMGFPSPA